MLALANKLSLNTRPIYRFVNKYSIDFDGVDDRIITDGADTVAQNSTYSFWCKSSTTGSNNGVFGHGLHYEGAFHFNYDGTRPLLYLGASNYVFWNDTSAQDDGEWHHWVVYADFNDISNSKLYVDGVLQTTYQVVTGTVNAYTESLTIGSDRQVGGNSFEGKIDEFAVYDRELTQDEITRMYNTYYSPNRVANGNFSQIGNEEVTNGDFATDSDWTLDTGWSINQANNVAVSDGTNNADILQPGSVVGKFYKATFTIPQNNAGRLSVYIGGVYVGNTGTGNTGDFTFYGKASDTTLIRFRAALDFDGTLTNISVKEVGQHWTFGDGWSIENDKAVCSTLSNNLTQDFGVTANRDYKVTVEVTDYTSGTLYVDLGGASAQTTSSLGNKTFNFTTSSTALLRFYGGSFRGSIDNVVVQELKHDATNLMLNAGAYQSANPLITSTKSMEFDGSDDYLSIGSDCPTGNFTVTSWVKKTGTGGWYAIFSAGTQIWFGLNNNGQILAHVGGPSFSTTGAVDINKWHNCTLTWNGTASFIYVDGVQVATSTGTSNPAATPYDIGKLSTSGQNYFDGLITEVGLYDRALTSLEVASLYNQGMPTNLLVNRNNYQSGNPTVFNTKQVDFDGTDDHLKVTNAYGSFTGSISAWVKRHTTNSWIYVVDFRTNSGVGYINISPAGNIDAGSSTKYVDGVLTSAIPQDNEWHHIVVTNISINITECITIGSRYIGTEFFNGDMSQVGLWNSTLTADEVSSLYNHGLPIDLTTNQAAYASSSNLVGYWRMGSGTLDSYPLIADQTNATLSSELVTNGDFSNGTTDWTVSSGTISVDNGRLKIDSVSGTTAEQTVTAIIGKTYKVTYDLTLGTATSGATIITGGNYPTLDAPEGTNIFYSVATSTSFRVRPRLGSDGTMFVDNISVKEVQGNPAIMTNQTSSDIENGSPYANLIQNNDFSEGTTDWVLNSNWSISNGIANADGTSNAVFWQDNVIQDTTTYSVTYTLSNFTQGSLNINLSGSAGVSRTLAGTYTETITSGTSPSGRVYFEGSGNFIVSVDNISVSKVNTGLQGYWKMGDGTNDEYPVIYDQTNPDLGSEIIANGDFTTDSGWTIGTGWSISGGKANATDAVFNSQLTDSTTLVAGKVYKISFDVSNYVKGNVNVTVGNVTSSTVSSEGSYTFYLTTSLTTPFRFSTYAGGSGTTLSVDNVSVKEVQGNPATMTNMVEGNITNQYPLTKIRNYYRMGDGILDGYPIIQDQTSPNLAHIPTTNLYDYSEDFSSWSVPGYTQDYGYLSPDGTNNATKLTATTTDPYIFKNVTGTTGLTYSASIYIKGTTSTIGEDVRLWIIRDNVDFPFQDFTITGEWQRIKFTTSFGTTPTSFVYLRLDAPNTNVQIGDEVYIFGSQLEQQSQATAYIKSDGIAAVRKSSTTNLITYSEDFSQWTTTGATTISATNLTSPIGTTNATRITGLTGSGGNDLRIFPSNFDSANKDLTFSVYLKGSGTLRIQMSNGVDQGIQKIVTLTSDWKRHQVFGDFNSTSSSSQFHCNIDDSSATATTYDVWGAQLEEQTQAETYAKTTGLPVTIDLFTENNYGTMTNMSASDIIEDTPNN